MAVRSERRLSAILAADIAGYSRHVGRDEEGTVNALRAHLKAIVPIVAEHGGHVVDTAGDGVLAEFPSAVRATEAAIAIQRRMGELDADLPAKERLRFRIGINVGDVVVEDGEIFGDGVNVAARLEQLAQPGDVLISGTAYDNLQGKIDLPLDYAGDQHVKNIARPVRTYRVRTGGGGRSWHHWVLRGRAHWRFAAIALVVAAVALGLLWHGRGVEPSASVPSLAVLPFGNLSGDPEQAYFAQGLADDLITDLSKISGVLVIARHSTSTYQDPSADLRDVARELGVRYVLEGSVRRSGDSVRINVQLIDGATGTHIWAERYDRAFTQIFTLQDEVIERIIEALSVRLTEGEKTQITRLPTRNLEAYDIYTRAEQKAYDLTEQSLRDALFLYQKAIQLDPQFADAYAGYARALVDVVSFDYQPVLIGTVARQQAYEAAERALQLNAQTPRAYAALGILQSVDGDHDDAIASVQKAVALAPNSADAELNMAVVLIYAGLQQEALVAMERVLKLNPKPQTQVYDYYALVLFMNKRYGEAVEAVRLGGTPESDLGLEVLAMAYARQGQKQNAHDMIQAIFKRAPGANLTGARNVYSHHRRPEDLDIRINALRDAGLPEWPYGFHGSPADQLDSAEIQSLAVDKLWVGHQYGGAPFVMQIDAKGNYAQRGSQGLTAGKILFRGNFMCMQSGALTMGREFCCPVYRNPGGNRESQDEYVFPDVATIWYFSVGS